MGDRSLRAVPGIPEFLCGIACRRSIGVSIEIPGEDHGEFFILLSDPVKKKFKLNFLKFFYPVFQVSIGKNELFAACLVSKNACGTDPGINGAGNDRVNFRGLRKSESFITQLLQLLSIIINVARFTVGIFAPAVTDGGKGVPGADIFIVKIYGLLSAEDMISHPGDICPDPGHTAFPVIGVRIFGSGSSQIIRSDDQFTLHFLHLVKFIHYFR